MNAGLEKSSILSMSICADRWYVFISWKVFRRPGDNNLGCLCLGFSEDQRCAQGGVVCMYGWGTLEVMKGHAVSGEKLQGL